MAEVKREGLIRDHWLIFGTGLFIFKTFPFFNYYFGRSAQRMNGFRSHIVAWDLST